MRKILSILLILTSLYSTAQYSPTGTKTKFVNGIALGTKDTNTLKNAADTINLTVSPDSTLRFRYKGFYRPLSFGVTGGFLPISDTATMLAPYTIGSGTLGYVPRWNGTRLLGNSLLYDQGTAIGLGTLTPATFAPFAVRTFLTVGGLRTSAYFSDGDRNALSIQHLEQYPTLSSTSGIQFYVNGALAQTITISKKAVFEDTVVAPTMYPVKLTVTGVSTFVPLSGTGSRVATLDASGNLTRGTVDPAAIGTVTSVAAGYGLTFTTITTSGTVTSDTTAVSTKLNVLNQLNKYTGTANTATVGTITSGVWNAGAVTSSGGISGTTGSFSSTLAATGLITSSGGVQFVSTANSGAGFVGVRAAQGLFMQSATGSSYDAALLNPAGASFIWRVPTGTINTDFLGAVTATSLSSSGDLLFKTTNPQATSFATGATIDLTAQFWSNSTAGAQTVTLPTTAGHNRVYTIRYGAVSGGGNTLTVGTTSSQNIINRTTTATTYVMAAGDVIQVQSDGTSWIIIAKN